MNTEEKKQKYLMIAGYITSKRNWLSEELLRWVIYESDILSFRRTGKSITGVSWIKSASGPLPSFR